MNKTIKNINTGGYISPQVDLHQFIADTCIMVGSTFSAATLSSSEKYNLEDVSDFWI